MELFTFMLRLMGGAATGYITNSLALQMLFRKIGPFGGVILKTKDEFIENTGSLVEKDIINHHTIENRLENEEFKKIFSTITFETFNIYLKKRTQNKTWNELPALEKNIKSLEPLLEKAWLEYTPKLTRPLYEKITIGDFFSKVQVDYIADKLNDILKDNYVQNFCLEKLIKNVYVINKNRYINEFIPQRIFINLSRNVKSSRDDYINDVTKILKNNKITKERLEKISSIQKLNKFIEEKTIADLIPENRLKKIINSVDHFLDKPELFSSDIVNIDDILDNFLNILSDLNYSILDFLDDKFLEKTLKPILCELLSFLNDELIQWLEENKNYVEKFIRESIQEVLESNTGIKNSIKLLIFNSMQNKNITEIIINNLKNKQGSRLEQKLINYIFDEVNKYNIGELIYILIKHNIIDKNNLKELLCHFLRSLDIENWLNENKIKDIAEVNLENIFDFMQEKYINKENLSKLIGDYINKLSDVGEFSLNNILNEKNLNKLSLKLQEILQNHIFENNNLKLKISEYINEYKKEQKLKDLVEDPDIILEDIYPFIKRYINKGISNSKNKNMSILVNRLNQKNIKKFNNFLLSLLENNLAEILEGNIKNLVSGNLNKLSAEEVREAVEKFMGRELKPITFFGALLGLGAGSVLYFVPELSGVYTLLTYGFIGYITNVIALEMIFKPYTPKIILGKKIPLTPGIVTKNKEIFARSMGEFVDEELINSKEINKLLEEYREYIINYLLNNNYQVVRNIFKDNPEIINGKIFPVLLSYIKNKKEDIVFRFCNYLGDLEIKQSGLSEKLKNTRYIDKEKIINNFEDNLVQYLNKKTTNIINSEENLSSIFPDDIIQFLIHFLRRKSEAKIENIYKILNEKKSFIKVYNNIYKELITENKLDDFLDRTDYKGIIDKIKNIIIKNIDNKDYAIIIDKLIIKKFKLQSKSPLILENIGGKVLIDYLKENQDNIVENILKKIITVLQNKKEYIKEKIILFIKQEIKNNESKNKIISILKTAGINTTFSLIDAEESIDKVIEYILNHRISNFFFNNKNDFTRIYFNLIEYMSSINIDKPDNILNQKNVSRAGLDIVDDQRTD
ncbi:MAG: DUF445 family protein, partial [Halanaerobiaceae bacterium]